MNCPVHPICRLLATVAVLGSAACQTGAPPAPARVGLGTMPTSLVALAASTSPGATLEFGVAPNGALTSLSAPIANDALPAAVASAVRRLAPGSDLLAAMQRSTALGPEYAVDVRKDGILWRFVVTPDGTLLASERELDAAEVPDAVLRGADRAVARGESVLIREVRRGAQVTYRFRHRDGEVVQDSEFAADGVLQSAVRRTPAIVELPVGRQGSAPPDAD